MVPGEAGNRGRREDVVGEEIQSANHGVGEAGRKTRAVSPRSSGPVFRLGIPPAFGVTCVPIHPGLN
jgi:hypothetical protein